MERVLTFTANPAIDVITRVNLVVADRKLQCAAWVVIVSLGAGGALAVSAEWSERLTAPTVPLKSRAGAGDSMVAGVVLGLARGRPLAEAVRFGLAAGTAAVMAPGTGLSAREDAERLFAAMGTGIATPR